MNRLSTALVVFLLMLWVRPGWADSILVGSVWGTAAQGFTASYDLTFYDVTMTGTDGTVLPLLGGAIIPATFGALNLQASVTLTAAGDPVAALQFLTQPVRTISPTGPTVVGTNASGSLFMDGLWQSVTGQGWVSAWFTPVSGGWTLEQVRYDLTAQPLDAFFQPIGVPEVETRVLYALGLFALTLVIWSRRIRRPSRDVS